MVGWGLAKETNAEIINDGEPIGLRSKKQLQVLFLIACFLGVLFLFFRGLLLCFCLFFVFLFNHRSSEGLFVFSGFQVMLASFGSLEAHSSR